MTEMRGFLPGFTVSDDAADTLVGQECPLVVGGMQITAAARVTAAVVTLDGLELDVEVPDTPATAAARFTLLHGYAQPRSLSAVVATHATATPDGGQDVSLVLTRLTYPADDPAEEPKS